jgi:hypothetical protein
MKKVVFKYFDVFCYAELREDDKDNNWFKPNNDTKSFGYSMEANVLFYNEELENIINSMFSVGRTEFKELLSEWFKDRYQLPVTMIL